MYICYVSQLYKIKSLRKAKIAGSNHKINKDDYYCNILFRLCYTFGDEDKGIIKRLDTSYGPFELFMVYKDKGERRYLDKLIVESNQPDFTSVVVDFTATLANICTYHYIPIGDYHIAILVLHYRMGVRDRVVISNDAIGCVAFLYYKGILLTQDSHDGIYGSNVVAGNVLKIICYYITEFILPGVTSPRKASINLSSYTCECCFWIHHDDYGSPHVILSSEDFIGCTLTLHPMISSIGLYTLSTKDNSSIMCIAYHKDNALYRFFGLEQVFYYTDITDAHQEVLYYKAKSSTKFINIDLHRIERKLKSNSKVKCYFGFLDVGNKDLLYEVFSFPKGFYVFGLYRLSNQNSCYTITERKVMEKYLQSVDEISSYRWKIAGDMNLVWSKAHPYLLIDVNGEKLLKPDEAFGFKGEHVGYRVNIFNNKTHVEAIILNHYDQVLKIEVHGGYGKMFLDALNYAVIHEKPIPFLSVGEKTIVAIPKSEEQLIVFMCRNASIYDAIVFEGNYSTPYVGSDALLIEMLEMNSKEKNVFYLLDFDGIIYKTDDTLFRSVIGNTYKLYSHLYKNYLLLIAESDSETRLSYALIIDFTNRNNVKTIKGKIFCSGDSINLVSTLDNTVFLFQRYPPKFIRLFRLYAHDDNLIVDESEQRILFDNDMISNSKYRIVTEYRINEDLLVVKINDLLTRVIRIRR